MRYQSVNRNTAISVNYAIRRFVTILKTADAFLSEGSNCPISHYTSMWFTFEAETESH